MTSSKTIWSKSLSERDREDNSSSKRDASIALIGILILVIA